MYAGYEGIYQWVRQSLAGADLKTKAPRLGLEIVSGGRIKVNFFGRDYLVDNEGVRPADDHPAGINHLSLVGHYAQSDGRGEPENDFLPLWRLSGTPEGGGDYERSTTMLPLHRAFGNDLAALGKKAAELGGQETANEPSGGISWIFHPFPKVAMKLIHHPADEEFEAEYRLLYDRKALDYMVFEALGFLGGVFIGEMTGEREAH